MRPKDRLYSYYIRSARIVPVEVHNEGDADYIPFHLFIQPSSASRRLDAVIRC